MSQNKFHGAIVTRGPTRPASRLTSPRSGPWKLSFGALAATASISPVYSSQSENSSPPLDKTNSFLSGFWSELIMAAWESPTCSFAIGSPDGWTCAASESSGSCQASIVILLTNLGDASPLFSARDFGESFWAGFCNGAMLKVNSALPVTSIRCSSLIFLICYAM